MMALRLPLAGRRRPRHDPNAFGQPISPRHLYTDVRAGDGLELDDFHPPEKCRSPDRPDERAALTADAPGVIRLPRKERLPSSCLWDAAEALGLRPPLVCHPAQGEAELGAQVIEALFERLAGGR